MKAKEAETIQRQMNIELQKLIINHKENEKYLKGLNHFASVMLKKNTIGEIVWEVTDNLKELGIVDCVIYLVDFNKQSLIQHAAYGPKQTGEKEIKNPIVIPIGEGIVGTVAKTGVSELISDTSKDKRYIVDDEIRLSEIAVPIIADGEIIGVIDSEHPKKNFYTKTHLDKFQTIASLVSVRLKNAIFQDKLQIAQKKILKLSTAVEQSSLSILITDFNGVIEFVNPAFIKLTGYSASESIGKKPNILKSGEQSDLFYDKLWNTIKQGNKWTGELINKKKNGDKYWVLASISPIVDQNNECTNFVYMQTDITRLKKLEKDSIIAKAKAEEADKAKSSFLANMSHEIRTPLNGIIGMIRELNKFQYPEDQKYYLNSAMKASQHLISMVNNILDITKIEAGEFHLVNNHFSIEELLTDIRSILEPNAIEKNIDLNINVDDNVPDVFIGDISGIRQILINLAGNAIKFTDTGNVSINCLTIVKKEGEKCNNYLSKCPSSCKKTSVSGKCSHLKFTIEDTGIGMNNNYLTNLFEKFQQEDFSISRKFGGTGLGLVITKQIVDLMNGEIKVKSEKNVGTKISVCIPLPVGDISMIEKKLTISNNLLNKDIEILIVEDSEMNRLVVSNTLKAINAIVTEVNNGQEAIEILQKRSFDIILMDIQMPVMNGIEASKIIRNNLEIKTPIIALTANAFKSEMDICKSIGMNDYVIKPFKEEHLLQVILKQFNISQTPETINLKEPANQAESAEPAGLYDLSRLKKLSMGNDEFVKKMLTYFVKSYPDYVKQLNDHFTTGNFESMKKLAHKLKPSLHDMGISQLKQDIIDIEKFSDKDDSIKTLKTKLKKVTTILTNVIDQVKTKELS